VGARKNNQLIKAMKFIKLAILAAAASLFASACTSKPPAPAPAPAVSHHSGK